MKRLALLSMLVALPALAEHGFPDWVKFPPQVGLAESQALVAEDLADVEVPGPGGATKTVRGKRWGRWLAYTPAAGEPALGFYNGSEARIAKAFDPVLAAAGWKAQFENEERTVRVLTQTRAGKTYLAVLSVDAPQGQLRLDVVETGGAARALVLTPPAKKPEALTDADDFPFLAPPAGSSRTGQGRGDDPLDVAFPGEGGEAQLVGSGTAQRSYQGPKNLSGLEFVESYRAALTKAGWVVLFPRKDAEGAANVLIAHYTRDGRDVWARLTYEYGAALAFTVADVGGEDWVAALKRDCRLALNGVTFDFDKATLRPESDGLLQKALATVKAVAQDVEVQGHTDTKGSDAYNLTLSEARAKAVQAWLLKHGADAKRLTAKGYGETVPVASNDTALGRAKNRRVQLVLTGCTAK